MSKTLYLECYSGISGDMTVAALLDLGADEALLREALASLPLDGYEIEITRVKKSGLDACDFRVILDPEHDGRDHDMEYLHGHDHNHSHDYDHQHNHSHSHEHEQWHNHSQMHEHGHMHRGLSEIREIIQSSELSSRAKETALEIFQILAEAEAKAHGMPVEQVHFHEVGAVDSIVDIAAVAVCLDNLDIEEVLVPELYEGRGTIRCQHGIIPVPVPAVTNIAAAHKLPLHMTDIEGELVTPTGAAIVAAVKTADMLPARCRILKTGMGAGKRDYRCTGVLRAMLIEPWNEEADVIWKLESNIDDCTGEALGYVMEELFAAGARDVYYTPIYMKKNRPAYQLNVICREEDIERLQEIVFRNTTTIGIRRVKMERTILKRENQALDTPLGQVRVKLCDLGTEKRIYPEYDSVVELCREHELSYQEVWNIVSRAASEMGL